MIFPLRIHMNDAYLSIGSNVNNRSNNIKMCLDLLHEHDLSIIDISSIYETEPIGYKKQKYFYNIVAHIKTLTDIYNLFNITREIEIKMGRNIKQTKNYPRIIDIDILTYANKIIESKDLTIPHPRLHNRKFVLIPWCEINSEFYIPKYNKSVSTLLKNVKDVSKVCKLNI